MLYILTKKYIYIWDTISIQMMITLTGANYICCTRRAIDDNLPIE